MHQINSFSDFYSLSLVIEKFATHLLIQTSKEIIEKYSSKYLFDNSNKILIN